jgi:hypothetical protein
MRCIMETAGELGDRRFVARKRSGREESPDSIVRLGERRAARLVTPGGCASGCQRLHGRAAFEGAATESATENKPPVTLSLGGRFEVNLGPAYFGRFIWQG